MKLFFESYDDFDDRYEEFLSFQAPIAKVLSSIGGDIDDFQGDLVHNGDDEDDIRLSFDSFADKDDKKYSINAIKALEDYFERETRFNQYVEVNCYKKREQMHNAPFIIYHIDISAQDWKF